METGRPQSFYINSNISIANKIFPTACNYEMYLPAERNLRSTSGCGKIVSELFNALIQRGFKINTYYKYSKKKKI